MRFAIAATLLALTGASAPAFADQDGGCAHPVSISLVNKAAQDIIVTRIQVMKRGGTWREVDASKWTRIEDGRLYSTEGRMLIPPEDYAKVSYQVPALPTFSCDSKRRFKITLACANGELIERYYPSATTWSTEGSVEINVGGKCSPVVPGYKEAEQSGRMTDKTKGKPVLEGEGERRQYPGGDISGG